MTSALILALDVGSSSVRCSAYDTSNNNTKLVTTSQRSRRSVCSDGRIAWFNLDDDKIDKNSALCLLDVIDDCVDDVLEQLRNDQTTTFVIRAIGFSSFVMNLIGFNRDGQFLDENATLTYACQRPGVNLEVEDLNRSIDEEKKVELYQKTGTPIHAAYALAQFRVWYRREISCESDRIVHKWQTIASACLSRWTGSSFLPISYSEASWMGLLNFHTCQYEPEILKMLPDECRKALPDLADYNGDGAVDKVARLLRWGIPAKIAAYSTTTNPYWERWPELRNARLFLGIGDGACANVGSKCCTVNRIACTVGTSAAARVCLRLPIVLNDDERHISVKPGLFCYRIDRFHVLVGGALTDGGSVVEWASTLLNLPMSSEAFQKCLDEVRYLAKTDYEKENLIRLTVAPFLSGERSTGFRGNATMSMLGLTRETTPALFLKSCLEGVTLRIGAIIELIRDIIATSRWVKNEECVRIICSGNALEQNELWRQMIADCCDLEVVFDLETQEGTSRGVVKLVERSLDNSDRVSEEFQEELILESTSNVPNKHAGQYWTRARKEQEALIFAMAPLYLQNLNE